MGQSSTNGAIYHRERSILLDKNKLCNSCKQPKNNHTKRCDICRHKNILNSRIYRLKLLNAELLVKTLELEEKIRMLRSKLKLRIVVDKPRQPRVSIYWFVYLFICLMGVLLAGRLDLAL